ncbi:SRPBCC family protein [Haladaptatus halobius]|uniref:SRPBCC family protein n=1 Tax=Haladaptatus halobius TaxID=2884875 RepID=UPI001D09A030|nr:SRPBCC domain-containing protein [Haladaptatus halobius]
MTDFDPTEYNMTIQRTFDAPRERVWQALTDPDQVRQWWGPEGFTISRCEMDVRPGGVHRVDMRAPDGTTIPHEGEIEEVVESERLVIRSPSTEDGEELQQPEIRNTITLVDHDDRTELTFIAEVITATPDMTDSLEGMEPVWSESLDSLATHLGEEV